MLIKANVAEGSKQLLLLRCMLVFPQAHLYTKDAAICVTHGIQQSSLRLLHAGCRGRNRCRCATSQSDRWLPAVLKWRRGMPRDFYRMGTCCWSSFSRAALLMRKMCCDLGYASCGTAKRGLSAAATG